MSTVLDLHDGAPGVPPLLARLVDDAALFPPATAALPEALAAHLRARQRPHSGMLGFFLCPVSRLGELLNALRATPPKRALAVSLVADTGLGGLPKAISLAQDNSTLLGVGMVEAPASSDVDANWLMTLTEFVPDDVVRVVEPRRGRPDWLDGVRRVAQWGCWPKLRCGGTSSESIPSVEEVADFLAVACASGRSFKATAGLHHAVRTHDEATGLTHHGLLNMLVGTARAVAGLDVAAALASTDGPALAAEAAALDPSASHAVRKIFACYGSVSAEAPVAELQRLGLL